MLPFGFDRLQMAGIDDQRRNAAADAVMHAVRQHVVLAGGVEIERARRRTSAA